MLAARENVLLRIWNAKLAEGVVDKELCVKIFKIMDERAELLGLYKVEPTTAKH